MNIRSGQAIYLVIYVLITGCGSRDESGPRLAAHVSGLPEDRAVLDALRRFVRETGAERLAIEPTKYLPSDLGKIDKTEVEFLSRQQLLDRHKGRSIAPVITRIHVYRAESDPPGRFRVAVNQEAAGGFGEGFKQIPYARGIDYSYQVEGDEVHMVSQATEIE